MNNNEQPKLYPNRFQPGNPGGPGRPKKETEGAYLNAIRSACTPDEFTTKLISMLNGNSWRERAFALEMIAHYTLGKPIQRTESANVNVIEEALQNWIEMKQQAITVVDPDTNK